VEIWCAKLKNGEVRLIKNLINNGVKVRVLTKMFKATKECIKSIKYGRTWSWLPAYD